jgi:hypothetical protein
VSTLFDSEDHAINPVFYVEYENTSGADKTIPGSYVGHDGQADLAEPNGESAQGASARGGAEADFVIQRQGLEHQQRTSSRRRI